MYSQIPVVSHIYPMHYCVMGFQYLTPITRNNVKLT
jgi:hypothetical protein